MGRCKSAERIGRSAEAKTVSEKGERTREKEERKCEERRGAANAHKLNKPKPQNRTRRRRLWRRSKSEGSVGCRAKRDGTY